MSCIRDVVRVLVVALLVVLPQVATGQLVKSAPPPKPAEKKATRAIDVLCEKVNAAYGTTIAATDVVGRLPAALHETLTHYYLERPADLAAKVAELEAIAARFDARWAEVTAAKTKADGLLAKASEARKGGRLAEARDLLLGGITPVEKDDKGQVSKKRDALEVRDVELPLLLELAGVLEDLKDFGTLVDVGAALDGRRKAYAVEEERILWIADAVDLHGFSAGQKSEIDDAMKYVPFRGQQAKAVGGMLARGLWRQINGKMLKSLRPADVETAQPGDMVIFEIRPDTITDTSAAFRKDGSFDVDHDCRETDKVDGVDYRTGKLIYRVLCRKERVTMIVTVDVAFAQPPPAFARTGYLWVIGKVAGRTENKGVQWKITDAVSPDTRWLATPGGFQF